MRRRWLQSLVGGAAVTLILSLLVWNFINDDTESSSGPEAVATRQLACPDRGDGEERGVPGPLHLEPDPTQLDEFLDTPLEAAAQVAAAPALKLPGEPYPAGTVGGVHLFEFRDGDTPVALVHVVEVKPGHWAATVVEQC